MPARSRRVPNAAQRYGTRHKQLRAALLAAFKPGQPCARCGKPIWNKHLADLGHTTDGTAYIGLEHQHCNRSEAARRGNHNRTPTTWNTSRTW